MPSEKDDAMGVTCENRMSYGEEPKESSNEQINLSIPAIDVQQLPDKLTDGFFDDDDLNMSGFLEPESPIVLTRGDKIEPQAINWLWQGWLPRGKLTLIAGAPGAGKTTIGVGLAAIVTAGGQWPGQLQARVGECVIWSGEDDVEDTLLPRFMASGGDRAKVHFLQGITEGFRERPFDPARDMHQLLTKLDGMKIDLLIIDPIVSMITGDGHKNAEVRRQLQPLVELAAKLGCALVGITHLSKGTPNRDPLERVSGSLAFGALARCVLIAGQLSNEQGGGRGLVKAKSNLGPDNMGFQYKIEQISLPDRLQIMASRIRWGERLNGTAKALLAGENAQRGVEKANALQFLREQLMHGKVQVSVLKEEAKTAELSWRTVERAKDELKIVPRKIRGARNGGWYWQLPKPPTPML